MAPRKIAQLIISIALVLLWARLGLGWGFYSTALVSQFLAVALASVCIFHFSVRRELLDLLGVLGTAAILAYVDFGILRYPVRSIAWFSFLGLGSFLLLALRLVWESNENRKILALALLPSLLFITSDWFAYYLLLFTEKLHPRVLDLYLYAFDAGLRIQFPFLIGQWFRKLPLLGITSYYFYVGLPVIIAVVYTGQLLRDARRGISAMTAFLITGPIGIFFYNLFPALGPIHVFQDDFPWHFLTLAQVQKLLLEPLPITGPRNAIPSLHMSWVLLTWWFSRGLSPWRRVLAMLFLLFTFLSTLGLGEHYFVDLVVAVPFSLFIRSLCTFELSWTNRERLWGIFAGLSLTLAWFALLRFAPKAFLFSALLPWGLIVVTVSICLYLENGIKQQVPADSREVTQSDALAATISAT